MAEVLRTFPERIQVDGGTTYTAQACGRQAGRMWEGWIEFVAEDGSDLRRTPRETTQPDRAALIYWAQGLSPTYLEGALTRSIERLKIVVHPAPEPYFDAPAPPLTVERGEPAPNAILDPFSVAAKGKDLLRKELGALRGWHLRNIIRAYNLADESLDLEVLTEPELVDLIVQKVEPAY